MIGTGPPRAARLLVAGLALALLVALPLGAPLAPTRGAEYTMSTTASYTVEPVERRVGVSVEVRFENTTPDPAGQFSVFEVVDLAIHPGASEVTARDGSGPLTVSLAERDGFTLASVRPRAGVRFGQEVAFTLAYHLPDGASPQLRIRPSLVAFPVWSFGTAGVVRVQLPGSFEVSVDGDEMTAERAAEGWVLESGEVADPTAWLAQVVAIGPASYDTLTAPVPLESGTVDLQVRAWTDDAAWGEATLDLLTSALPLLEERIGLPYPGVGPLVVVETVSGPEDGMGEPGGEGTQVMVGFDEPAFTILHQAAHVWLSESLVADRWIAEGFASWVAAGAAAQLEVDPPYDPASRREELADAAFPLISWGAGEATLEQDAFAYAAAWAVAAEVADLVGDDAVRLAWQRILADVGPYEPVADEPPAVEADTRPGRPVDSRTLLDQLEAVSGADVAAVFEAWVLDEATSADLPDRATARAAYAELLTAAEGWGAPDPVRIDMTAWRFASAEERIAESIDWLAARDELAAAAAEAGLALPQRLRDRYRTAGGGPDARAELEAEAAVVAHYAEALDAAAAERGLLERLGLLGGPDPDLLLREANALFADGDLRGAAESVEAARVRLERAAGEGLVRLLAAVALVVVLLALAVYLARRRRPDRATGYTAGP